MMKSESYVRGFCFALVMVAIVLLVVLVGACGPAAPTATPAPMATEASVAPTRTPLSPPTETAPPLPTATEPAAPPVEASVPPTMELRATVIAGLPPTPTPDIPGGESTWGDVAMLPLDTGGDGPLLWTAFTVGMGFYDWEHGHTLAVYTYGDEGWQMLSQLTLTDCAEYINPDSLVQVEVEPSRIWLELQSFAGAHSGCFDLFSFDGKALRREVGNFNSSPGAGSLVDLDGDGLLEVILNYTENYVFCYACSVRLPIFGILRWDGEQFVDVMPELLPETAPADVRHLNNLAVELTQGLLWKDAQAMIAKAAALEVADPEVASMVAWNQQYIDMHAEALAEQVAWDVYPLLSNVFYGDYAAAVSVMRPYSVDEIWGPSSPLVAGTVAEGWEGALSDWLVWFVDEALPVAPDLAPAYFVRAWGTYLLDPASPAVLADVERAGELAPDDLLFADSLAYLKPVEPGEKPGLAGIYEPLDSAACYELGQAMMQTLNVTVTVREAPFEDYIGGDTGTGCQLSAGGTGADFESFVAVADDLVALLAGRGWDDDFMYAADGPTGTGRGFRQGGKLCLLSVGWEPSEDANCPTDRPISECELEPEQQLYSAILNCAQPATGAPPEPKPTFTPTLAPAPKPRPTATPVSVVKERWAVRTLLAGPGEPGRLYALLAEVSSGAWPAERVRLLVSDDYGQSWSPFPGGLPAEECVVNVNLDYASSSDALYASTCKGLYRWSGSEWQFVSPRQTGMVSIVYGQPNVIWATESFGTGAGVIRSDDSGATWSPRGNGLVSFNGVANVAVDPRDANMLYAVIWPKYAGSYLRRGTAEGQWQTMPTPLDSSQIDTGISIDGATGALYVTAFTGGNWHLWRTLNPSTLSLDDVRWEVVHDFGPDVSWATMLASGWSPEGLALYANLSYWLNKDTGTVGPPKPHRSLDGGQTWEPLPIP